MIPDRSWEATRFGHCGRCVNWIIPGDFLRLNRDGVVIHEDCRFAEDRETCPHPRRTSIGTRACGLPMPCGHHDNFWNEAKQ